MSNIIAIIPARSGSKRLPKKNIKTFNGYPLIAYSIAAARLSQQIQRVIVSTDSQEIADIARRYGAEVPFLRPVEYADDSSPDIDFVLHAFKELVEYEDYPEYMVHLRPVAPLRQPGIIDDAISYMLDHPDATSLRSVYKFHQPVCKMFSLNGSYLEGLCPDDTRSEYYNLPGQSFPSVYCPSSYVDIIRRSTVYSTGSLHGDRILAYLTDDIGDIDTLEQFEIAEIRGKLRDSSHQTLLNYLDELS